MCVCVVDDISLSCGICDLSSSIGWDQNESPGYFQVRSGMVGIGFQNNLEAPRMIPDVGMQLNSSQFYSLDFCPNSPWII